VKVDSAIKPNEQVKFWPYDYQKKTFIVIVYAEPSRSPLNFKPTGFLVLDENEDPLNAKKLSLRIARDFHIWYTIYFHPVVKNVIFAEKVFERLRKNLQIVFEDCSERYQNNQYKTNDPSKENYYRVLKKLDLDIINNKDLIIRHVDKLEDLVSLQNSICDRCSYEKINKFHQLLLEYKLICNELSEYLAQRGKTFYEFERSIKEAYRIDLQTSKYSFFTKLGWSIGLWLLNTPLPSLALPFLPELFKMVYQRIAGYKSLIKGSERYFKEAQKISLALNWFDIDVNGSHIRKSIWT